MPINCERENSLAWAWEIGQATIKKWRLDGHFSEQGKNFKTYHCQLTDPQSNTIFYGCGKGLGLQSKISACFEALEHYAVHNYCHNHTQQHYHSLADPQIVNKLKELRLLDEKIYSHAQKIPFVHCAEVITGESLYYPFYLLDPRYTKHPAPTDQFNYQPYAWHACDSGIASGTSAAEAGLHALNEAVERDAYSLFLIRTFFLKQKIPVIAKESLPRHLFEIVQTIEADYHEKLIIVDITSDLGIPSFFVSMTKQGSLIQPVGCGTSLYKEYALERALLESLQPVHLYNQHLVDNQRQILAQLSTTPLLAQCAKADLSQLSANFQQTDFNNLPGCSTKLSVTQQMQLVIQRIRSQGFAIYTTPIADKDTGFHCAKYLIPGLEQFYLVETGKAILPNARGMALIKQANGTAISVD